MTINITNLLKRINERVAVGGASQTEQNRYATLNKFLNGYSNVVQYQHLTHFDSAAISNEGIIALNLDSDEFYISHRNQWKKLTLGAHLDESRVFPGDDYGFVSGGLDPSFSSLIERFPFASFSNALTLGDLTTAKIETSGQSSELKGYTTGGSISTGAAISEIEKFDFTNEANVLTVGDLNYDRSGSAGLSTNTHALGFAAGGATPSIPSLGTAMRRIYKFPFANEAVSTIHGNLYAYGSTQGRSEGIGVSHTDRGFVAGGVNELTGININSIERFDFVNFNYSTPVASLTSANSKAAGNASETHGYICGGFDAFSLNKIEQFSFTSPHSVSHIGDLTAAKRLVSGQSSRTDGYISGGFSPSISTIETFPFSSSTPITATTAGDLVGNRHNTVGHQV